MSGCKLEKIRMEQNPRDIINFIVPRLASSADDYAVGRLLFDTFSHAYLQKMNGFVMPKERIDELWNVRYRRKNGAVCVLELGEEIVGTFCLISPGSSISEAWLDNAANLKSVAVDSRFQGLGFSTLILAYAEQIANNWSADHICLHVQKGADKVANLYKNFGYERDRYGDLVTSGLDTEGYFYSMSKVSSLPVRSIWPAKNQQTNKLNKYEVYLWQTLIWRTGLGSCFSGAGGGCRANLSIKNN